jgi:hypothetical protein
MPAAARRHMGLVETTGTEAIPEACGGNYKDGLIRIYSDDGMKTGHAVDSKLMWAMGNYSRFIRPGAVRLSIKAFDQEGNEVSEGDTRPYRAMLSAFRNKDLGLVNTREMFKRAVAGGYAIPAFNFNTMEQMQAIVQAAVETKSPVIMQVSKGARNYANGTILRYMAEGAVQYAIS